MIGKLQRPLLVGGAALTLSIWVLETFNHVVGEWGIYVVVLVAAGGVSGWWRLKPNRPIGLPQLPPVLDSAIVQQAIVAAEKIITQLGTEVADPQEPGSAAAKPQVSMFQSAASQIATDLNRDLIRIAIMGGKGSGKTTLIQQLQTDGAVRSTWRLQFSEVPSFAATAATGVTGELVAYQQAIAADLLLFLVTGDITDPEFQTLKQLAAIRRVVLVFNKQDQYLPADRQLIVDQLQKRGQGVLAAKDVVAIATAPKQLKVRQHQTDGNVKEWLEDQPPDMVALTERLEQIVQQEGQNLILASSFSNAQGLQAQAKTLLNEVRRTRALPVVEQFQWLAAGAAFASPLPAMDLVATVAINAQMILDVGTIYRQKFSLQQAQKSATTLGSLMLKLGLVELSTQAIANLLKTNAVTYVAGGCIQGVSAAYLTRVAGLSLIEYFHTQDPNLTLTEASPLAIERFSQILQRVFQQNQQLAFLKVFTGQAIERLPVAQSQLTAGTAPPFIVANPTTENGYAPVPLHQTETNLEQNGSGVPLAMPNLDSTTLPSP